MAMGIAAVRSDQPEPETAIALEHEHGFSAALAVGFQQGHAELFGHFMALGSLAQAPQQGIYLRERDKAGASFGNKLGV